MILGVTGSAQLLGGYLSGLLSVDSAQGRGGELAYHQVSINADGGSIEVKAHPSGNRFRISVEQIGSTE